MLRLIAGIRHSKHWNVTMSAHDVTVHGLEDTPLERARDTIVYILYYVRTIVLQPFRPTDRVGLGIESSSLNLGLPV